MDVPGVGVGRASREHPAESANETSMLRVTRRLEEAGPRAINTSSQELLSEVLIMVWPTTEPLGIQ